ncbi:predicted protein [Nematostella vectensis]|uniref:Protein ABHD14A n=2 Tax=Nematostella vectensis TaxID=45351 RepID=A7SQ73_NEMVE|nr:predicted protein [Nematostella vectensis]|eukprot:XP_001626216.1 predicted protein [Nematostella vectensis]
MVSTGYLDIEGSKEAIFYRHVNPENAKMSLLFLHGQAFKSKTWQDIGTLDFLSKKGYRVMAIDLPSFGNSKMKLPVSMKERGELLDKLISLLELHYPVLVAPSMSGSFALPFIFSNDNAKKLRGFIPIAPVHTDQYKPEQYKSLKLKTMIVYGQDDKQLGLQSLERLKNIPERLIKRIDGAGHACYMNNTAEFHSYLEEFLESLEKTSVGKL